MKNVLIYATCQGGVLAELLAENEEYLDRYNPPKAEQNYPYIQKKEFFIDKEENKVALCDTDVFIYQPLDNIYGRNSTQYLMQFLKPTCIKIAIPYVVNDSFWPFSQVIMRDLGDEYWKGDADVDVTRNLDVIDFMVLDGLTPEKILELYDKNEIDWNYDVRYRTLLKILRFKELIMDVTICDMLEENLRNRRMFIYYSHPSLAVYRHMDRQICGMLGVHENKCKDEDLFATMPLLTYHFLGLPTSSVNHFGFRFTTRLERQGADLYYRNLIKNYLSKNG